MSAFFVPSAEFLNGCAVPSAWLKRGEAHWPLEAARAGPADDAERTAARKDARAITFMERANLTGTARAAGLMGAPRRDFVNTEPSSMGGTNKSRLYLSAFAKKGPSFSR